MMFEDGLNASTTRIYVLSTGRGFQCLGRMHLEQARRSGVIHRGGSCSFSLLRVADMFRQ